MTNGKNGNDKIAMNVLPAGSIIETDGKILLRLEMPGVKKDGLEIRIDGNELKIVGKRHEERTNGRYLVNERNRGDYRRIYTLDETIDREKVEATMENGVLALALERKESEKPRRITVKAG